MRRDDFSRAAANVVTNLLAMVGGVIDTAFHVLAARLFGVAAYGLYRWAMSGIDVLARLSPLGADFALLRHVPTHRVSGEAHLERATLVTAVWLTLTSGTFLGVLTFVVAGPLARAQGTPEAAAALRWLAPSLPLSALVMVLVYATMAAKTTRYNLLVKGLGQPLLLLSLAALASVWWRSLAGLAAAHLVAMVLACVLALAAAVRVFGRTSIAESFWPFGRQASAVHPEMIRFAIPLGLSEFVNALLQRADLILIGFLAGNETVGIYAGAEFISRAVSGVRYGFDSVASPLIAEALERSEHNHFTTTLRVMTRWTTILTTGLFVVMIATRRQLLAFFPASFALAEGALVVLMLGRLADGSLGLTGCALAMSGRSRLMLANNIAAASVNVVLCLVLVPRFGVLGAAVAAASAFVVLQMIQGIEVAVLWRTVPVSRGFGKALVAGLVALGTVEWILRLPAPGIWHAVESGAAAAAIYAAVVLLLGIEPDDRAALVRGLAHLTRQSSTHAETSLV